MGESGCGKSTLGRAILRLAEPTAGQVIFDGTDVAALGAEPLRLMRRRMQMVFQDPMASLEPAPERRVASSPSRCGRTASRADATAWAARVRELLDAVGLPAAAAAEYPHEFSGGQRQRIGIARAIVLEARPDHRGRAGLARSTSRCRRR